MLPSPGVLPTASGWVFEAKWDGIRTIGGCVNGTFRLMSRRGRDIAAKFPELATITAVGEVVLDGELLVFTDELHSDFHAAVARSVATRGIQARAEARPATVMTFDVLSRDGKDLRRLPFSQRRAVLESLPLPPEWVVPPISDNGPAMVAASAEHGLEGVVAKRLNSRYVSGRSRAWVKIRHSPVIDAVVVGWTERDRGTISLLLAEAAADGFAYIGQCPATKQLLETLTPLRTPARPAGVPARRGVHWVRPVLPVEVESASRTPSGHLRHAKLLRARLDELP
jgi:bifunctional non-homologous end joining protein LigD